MTTDVEPAEPLAVVEPIRFDGVIDYLTTNAGQVEDDLRDYYSSYTGRFFEDFSTCGPPNMFDANDLAACASLSAPIEGRTLNALWSRIEDLSAALANCPDRTATLAGVDPGSDRYAALSDLYDTIRAIPGMGKVRASKLLASKRPALVPIRDRHVEAILDAGRDWWEPWRQLVCRPEITELVERATPPDVSRASAATLLRRLDVILWKEAKRRTDRG